METYSRIGVAVWVPIFWASDELIRISNYLTLCILTNNRGLGCDVNLGAEGVGWLDQVDDVAGICAEIVWICRIIEPFRSVARIIKWDQE